MGSYLSIIFGTTFIAWLNNIIKTKKDFFFKMSLLFLAVIAGLRWEVENDYLSYYSIFNGINLIERAEIEIGYVILNKIFYNLGFHFNFMLFFIACFEMILFYKFLKYFSLNKKSYYIYIFLFLATREYFFMLSGIRQGIAICFFIFSLKFLYEKDIKKFALLCIIGSLFHRSILLFLIYEIFCYKIGNKKWINLTAFAITFSFIILGDVLSNFFIKFLTMVRFEEYTGYVKFQRVVFGTGLGFLSKVVAIVVLFFLYKKEKNKKYNFILSHIQFFYILTLLRAVGLSQFYRLPHYYICFILFLPEIIANRIKYRFFINVTSILLGILIFVKTYIGIQKTMEIQYKRFNDEYRLIFNKNDIYKGKVFLYDQEKAKVIFY